MFLGTFKWLWRTSSIVLKINGLPIGHLRLLRFGFPQIVLPWNSAIRNSGNDTENTDIKVTSTISDFSCVFMWICFILEWNKNCLTSMGPYRVRWKRKRPKARWSRFWYGPKVWRYCPRLLHNPKIPTETTITKWENTEGAAVKTTYD